MKNLVKREPVRRALRTFIQAACGYVVVNIAALDMDVKSAVRGFIVATIAAGIAAVMNMEGGKDKG